MFRGNDNGFNVGTHFNVLDNYEAGCETDFEFNVFLHNHVEVKVLNASKRLKLK